MQNTPIRDLRCALQSEASSSACVIVKFPHTETYDPNDGHAGARAHTHTDQSLDRWI